LVTASITEAAKESGISRKSIYFYLSLPFFQKALNKARFEQLSLAIGSLQRAAIEAAEILISIAKDSETPASVKLAACKAILESGFKGAELLNFEGRLSLLEEEANV